MLLSAIEAPKQQYYSRVSKKLIDSSASLKAYWSLLKTFLSNKKTPCILHYFIIKNLCQTSGTEAELFNNLVSKQYTLSDNATQIPAHSI